MQIHGTASAESLRQVRQRIGPEAPRPEPREGGGAQSASFVQLLQDKVEETNAQIHEAEQAAGDLTVGKSSDVQGTMLALERADMHFRMMTAVRNRALDAYREVMRMNV